MRCLALKANRWQQLCRRNLNQTHVCVLLRVFSITMGIRGLSSYIQNRSSKYLKDHDLQNCDVVIDGNNMLHFIFSTCPRQNASFGGDYNFFTEHVKDVFRLFKNCKVNPILVFDGGLDVGNRKYKTRLVRAKQKLIASIKVKPSNQHRMSVLPLLIKTTFLAVLKELKVEVIQCQFEADLDIAALARGLKCPVISNDSDFYVMDVLVIPLGSIEFTSVVQTESGKALKCKLFKIDIFLKSIGYEDAKIFPLLGTLLGNDYADGRLFENIFSQIHIPKSKTMTDQHRRLQGMLEWLKGQDIEDAISQMLTFVKKTNRNKIEIAIRTSLSAYEDENKEEMSCTALLKEKTILQLTEQGIPPWFAELYTSAEIHCWVLEIMMSERAPYQSQLEAVELRSSFSCCFDLFQSIAWMCAISKNRIQLKTLWRKGTELVFKRIPIAPEHFKTPLPQLAEFSSIGQDQRRKLLFDIILEQDCGRLLQLPEELQLIFVAVIHWTRHSLTKVKTFHLDALMASLIHLSVVEARVGRIRSVQRADNLIKSKKADDPAVEYLTAVKNTFKFYDIDDRMMTHDVNYDRRFVHTLNEFQATYYYALTLNQILDTGLKCANISSFYCGSFIYQAASLFRGHQDRLKVAEKLYGPGSSILLKFCEYTDVVYEAAPSSLKDWVPHGPNKPRKRTKKKKEKVTRQSDSSSSGEESGIEDISDLIGNRFSLLSLA